ncbi:hypothetical protein [Lysinibacillus parviboronicapiens]|uniref:hypothetical protein n=1 Tax=Lysinibacillus parviboronicapiens TaxID=436516 RepID=UPI0012905F30|nr:hypothetical protein [Lysinibacillus parviboronicapiens]
MRKLLGNLKLMAKIGILIPIIAVFLGSMSMISYFSSSNELEKSIEEEQASTMNEMASASEQLAKLATNLQEESGKFKV